MTKLTLITISKIKHNNRTFYIEPRVTIYPKYDSVNKIYYTDEIEYFNFVISGKNLEELLNDFSDQLNIMWEEYVLSDDTNFTYDALEIKEKLQNKVLVEN